MGFTTPLLARTRFTLPNRPVFNWKVTLRDYEGNLISRIVRESTRTFAVVSLQADLSKETTDLSVYNPLDFELVSVEKLV